MGCIFSRINKYINEERKGSVFHLNNKRKIDSSPEGVTKRIKSADKFKTIIEI